MTNLTIASLRRIPARYFGTIQMTKNATQWGGLIEKIEEETEVKRSAALNTLYQKTQASLMLNILSKLPKNESHPLNTLRYKYFEQMNSNDNGMKMFTLLLISKSLSSSPSAHVTSEGQCKCGIIM